VKRAEHPVAVRVQLALVRFDQPLEGFLVTHAERCGHPQELGTQWRLGVP
jgi:hypothetical protein